YIFFFFQAEDGIRDRTVTGVQTCALPIFALDVQQGDGRVQLVDDRQGVGWRNDVVAVDVEPRVTIVAVVLPLRQFAGRFPADREIGRASCRERVWMLEMVVDVKRLYS